MPLSVGKNLLLSAFIAAVCMLSCGTTDPQENGTATVQIKNFFDNPANAFNPPWTIIKSSYLGVEFGNIPIGATSEAKTVTLGRDYVLMVASWGDPSGAPEHCLPIASKDPEEVVSGQNRTINISLTNHQGPCPPQGVAPIPEDQYEKIRQLWPEFNFKPYAERAQNPQCAN